MASRRRKAEFDAYLIIVDEPQVICLDSKKIKIIAVAVPENERGFNFIAASVTPQNWDKYLRGSVDLRYLFTYPQQRSLYTFNSAAFEGDTIFMDPHEDSFDEELLPSASIFSTSHTEVYKPNEIAGDIEQLFIDGEWGLNEFGSFYQKYSDIYALSSVLRTANRGGDERVSLRRIQTVFRDKPFRGGSSYVHFFDDVEGCVRAPERLTLDAIQYASPGDVKMNGDSDLFADVERMIENFIRDRILIIHTYGQLREYLSKRRMLTMAAENFDAENPNARFILESARQLGHRLQIGNFDTIEQLCNLNALVIAKVTLAVHRRIESAAAFFAQGRMSFDRA